MRLRVSERPSLVTFRKAAFVDLAPLRWLHNGWEVEVGWRASTMVPLFPVFAGRIVTRHGELLLSGWYAPPFGVLGQIADRLLLRIAATGTGNWLLSELDRAATEGMEAGAVATALAHDHAGSVRGGASAMRVG